jgi:hypothetical protein
MPRPNHLLIACLVLLGLAVLIRTVAIGQRAYDIVLSFTSGDDGAAPARAATVSEHTEQPLAIIQSKPMAPPVDNAPLLEDTQPEMALEAQQGEGSSAKPEAPRQTASQKQKVAPTPQPRRHKGYSYHYYDSKFQRYWGPVVW